MQFGKRVRELREQRGLLQKELAELLEVGPSHVNKVERDRLHFGDYPSAKFIHKLADELDADEDELLLLNDRVPKRIRKRIRERPELFEALVGCANGTLDWVFGRITCAEPPYILPGFPKPLAQTLCWSRPGATEN